MSLLVAGGFRGRSVLSFLGAPGHSSRIPWLVRGWKDIFGPWLVGPGIVSCLWFFFLLLHLSPNSCSPLHAASGAARAPRQIGGHRGVVSGPSWGFKPFACSFCQGPFARDCLPGAVCQGTFARGCLPGTFCQGHCLPPSLLPSPSCQVN